MDRGGGQSPVAPTHSLQRLTSWGGAQLSAGVKSWHHHLIACLRTGLQFRRKTFLPQEMLTCLYWPGCLDVKFSNCLVKDLFLLSGFFSILFYLLSFDLRYLDCILYSLRCLRTVEMMASKCLLAACPTYSSENEAPRPVRKSPRRRGHSLPGRCAAVFFLKCFIL